MSKQALSGTADLLEALLMTAVMSYFLKLGQYTAAVIEGEAGSNTFNMVQPFGVCGDPIEELWYLLLVPLAAISWSVLFFPSYTDLPIMTLHGIGAYAVSWGLGKASGIGTFN